MQGTTEILTKGREIWLTDARNLQALRVQISGDEPKIAKAARKLWDGQREILTIEKVEAMMRQASLTPEISDRWKSDNYRFTNETVRPYWISTLMAAGTSIAPRVNRAKAEPSFTFNGASIEIQRWIEEQGGRLITNLNETQLEAVQMILKYYTVENPLSPYELAKILRPSIGLTKRESLAVIRFYNALIAEGLDKAQIIKQLARYSAFLHKMRAERIARTELAMAYNRGQYFSLLQAREGGWIEGEVEKTWLTASDERTCDTCDSLDGETVKLDEYFSIGLLVPPAHPQCRCTVGYRVIRR